MKIMRPEREIIVFRGHRNILGLHRNSLEITREAEISRRADCIVGVGANKACLQLNAGLKEHILGGGKLGFELRVVGSRFEFTGRGSKSLQLIDPLEMVLRRSDFASGRTAAIKCEAAAIDIPRSIIKSLQDPSVTGELQIEAIESSSFEEDSETIPW